MGVPACLSLRAAGVTISCAVGLFVASFVDLANRFYWFLVLLNAEKAFQQKLFTTIPNANRRFFKKTFVYQPF